VNHHLPGVYIQSMGMACPVGLYWAAAFAAMRAGVDMKQELPYRGDRGESIVGSKLAMLGEGLSPEERWFSLLTYALQDVVWSSDKSTLGKLPMIFCLPPGAAGKAIEPAAVAREVSRRLEVEVPVHNVRVVTGGAPEAYRAIASARGLLLGGFRGKRPPATSPWGQHPGAQACLVAAADSLVGARALLRLSEEERLLSAENAGGIIPGEAACCILLSAHSRGSMAAVRGLGFGQEKALASNDIPFRAEGAIAAARAALGEAGLKMHELDFRFSNCAGDGYSFKEQALVTTRLLGQNRKEKFPLWQCADSLGDTGAAAGLCGLVSAVAGFSRRYAPGPRAIGLVGSDSGERAAVVLEACGG
jgi:3-oxoacyl-[acyl-carrier-protein] synthase-1